MHGLSGIKERPHLDAFAQAFIEYGYTAVRFDSTNTFGESDGKYEDATLTNSFEDLEDVIKWAKTQEWYIEPFCLCGHSLGAISGALFAEKNPALVKGLAPVSTIVSGALWIEAEKKSRPAEYVEWERTGWRIASSESTPGLVKRLKWSPFKEDILKYDLLQNVDRLTMPVLLITGENDGIAPAEHQEIFYKALPGRKELHIIKNGPHTFCDFGQLAEIKGIFAQWIKIL